MAARFSCFIGTVFVVLVLFTGSLPTVVAQEEIARFGGDINNGFGTSLGAAGDVDGDGWDDVIIGAPEHVEFTKQIGMVQVFSGRTGVELFTFVGEQEFGWFAQSVDGSGDVNGDGFSDLIVGEPCSDRNGDCSGTAWIYSGMDGSVLLQVDGDEPWDGLGHRVRGVGDIDLDGKADFAVSSVFADLDGTGRSEGRVRVYSGQDASVIHEFWGSSLDYGMSGFGWDLAGNADVNADGFPDLIVGAIFDDADGTSGMDPSVTGSVIVYSGKDGGVLHQLYGDHFDSLGAAVDGLADLNGDGMDEFVASALESSSELGYVRVHSGSNGAILFEHQGLGVATDDFFGASLSRAGDVNLDGFEDVLVGSNPRNYHEEGCRIYVDGYARLFSGATGAELYRFQSDFDGDQFGSHVGRAGDFNRDGLPDVLIGAPADRIPSTAILYSGNDLFLRLLPRIVQQGDLIDLTTLEGRPFFPTAMFLVDVNGMPVWSMVGGIGFFDSTLRRSIIAVVPPGLSSLTLRFQSFAIDGSGRLIDSAREVVRFE